VTASGLAGAHSSNLIATRKLSHNVFVCGDFVNAPCEGQGLMAPRVMIATGHQANMVVRILGGQRES
jgi:sulfur carrier protein ThiS adenylyltransferase